VLKAKKSEQCCISGTMLVVRLFASMLQKYTLTGTGIVDSWKMTSFLLFTLDFNSASHTSSDVEYILKLPFTSRVSGPIGVAKIPNR
jgi:hypothetical protein